MLCLWGPEHAVASHTWVIPELRLDCPPAAWLEGSSPSRLARPLRAVGILGSTLCFCAKASSATSMSGAASCTSAGVLRGGRAGARAGTLTIARIHPLND